MAETKRYRVRSLQFADVDGAPYLSVCTEEGDYVILHIDALHCALLNEGAAAFVGKRLRDNSHS